MLRIAPMKYPPMSAKLTKAKTRMSTPHVKCSWGCKRSITAPTMMTIPEIKPRIERTLKKPNSPPPMKPWYPFIMPPIHPPKPVQFGPPAPNHANPTIPVMRVITPPTNERIYEVVGK
jgi:hypothetical protein